MRFGPHPFPVRVSRNGHTFKQWPQLAEELAHAVRAKDAILDGEICCLEPDGRSSFHKLLFRRKWPYFYCFDALSIDDEDLTGLPLLERKRRLLRILPKVESRVLYLDHIVGRVCELCRAACKRDLEGIVAKWAHGTYQTDGRCTSWIKIKNPTYSHMEGRHDLFASRRPEGMRRQETSVRPELRLLQKKFTEGLSIASFKANSFPVRRCD